MLQYRERLYKLLMAYGQAIRLVSYHMSHGPVIDVNSKKAPSVIRSIGAAFTLELLTLTVFYYHVAEHQNHSDFWRELENDLFAITRELNARGMDFSLAYVLGPLKAGYWPSITLDIGLLRYGTKYRITIDFTAAMHSEASLDGVLAKLAKRI